jgi:hypothetical protein
MAFGVPPVILGDTSGSGYATAAIEKSLFLEQVIVPEQIRYAQRLMGMLWPEMMSIHPSLPIPVIDENGNLEPREIVDITPEGGTGINPDVWVLEFNQMAIMDKISTAQTHNIYGALGVLSKNEMRQDIGRKPTEEGEAPADNSKAPAGGPPSPPVPGTDAAPPDPNDIRGLAGSPEGGRGANGTMTNPAPRRPMDSSIPVPANASSVGMPMGKRAISDIEKASEIVKAARKKIDDNSATIMMADDITRMPTRVKEETDDDL